MSIALGGGFVSRGRFTCWEVAAFGDRENRLFWRVPKEEKCFQGLAFLNSLDEHLDPDFAEEELIDASILFDDYSG
ncbi:hypothetical protein [Corynebacterium cystitidis]|nr:hypothetical protein [Corynebacterium cystitidis]